MRSIVLGSFRDSFRAIWSTKAWFSFLVFLQIVFFLMLFFASTVYQTKILERMKAISDYMSAQQVSDVDLAKNILEQKDILGQDIASIGKNFSEIQHYFRVYILWIFVIFVFYLSFAFSVAYKITNNSFVDFFPKLLLVSFAYLSLIFGFFYLVMNVAISQIASPSSLLVKYVPFVVISLILAYFMFISFSILKKTGIPELIQKTVYIGIKKAHYALFVYALNILLAGFFLYLVVYFTEKSVLLTLLFIIALLKSLAFGKIHMIKMFEKLVSL